MSYAVSLQQTHCPTCNREDPIDFDWNYTSNCAWMWREAGADLAEFQGKPAGGCASVLADAIAVMEREPDRFKAMNPANGWGDYTSLLQALKEMLVAFRRSPTAIVHVSR